MKFINKILVSSLSVLALLGTASCDYLDVNPENSVPEENVDFTNLDNMYQPVSGSYASLRTNGMHWVIGMLTVVRDDDVWSGRVDDQADLVTIGEDYVYNDAWWGINETWNQYYGMIKIANAALESLDSYAENIPAGNETLMAKYRSYCGEVKIIRAYAYYRLTQAFGDVIILRSNDQVNMQRSKRDVVYKYVLEDLEYAANNVAKVRPNEMEHYGAFSAYTAMTLAAKIYMNMGDYANVEKLTDEIINSNKFELYPDFYQLFKIPGKLCNESIMECQTTDFGTGSGDLVDADQFFPCAGPANDGNISGWGFIGYLKEFRDWAYARGETVRATTSFLLAGSTTPDGDVIRPLQNPTQTDCWNGKYYVPTNQLTEGRTKYGCNNNIRILRYADVLLMNAEAKVRLGKNGDAPFNLVRKRADMPELTGVTVDQILDERRMELCCEWGDRYNDLIRTGKAATVLGGNGWTADKTYFPVPFEQKNSIPELKLEPLSE